jgi:hypothetical protein
MDLLLPQYKHQAQAWLNAFWKEHGSDAELLFKWYSLFIELDTENKDNGNALDEFQAHRFVEKLGNVMTVVEFRETFKKMDLSFDKKISLIEYCCYHFKSTPQAFVAKNPPVDPPTNTNEALMQAQRALNEVQNELNKIDAKKSELTAAASAGGVKGMKAKNELEQIHNADNTELNKAFLTAEAAVRKAAQGGGSSEPVPPGTLWWMTKELEEMKKYRGKTWTAKK